MSIKSRVRETFSTKRANPMGKIQLDPEVYGSLYGPAHRGERQPRRGGCHFGGPAETTPWPPDPGLFTQSPAGTRRITPGRIGGTGRF